MAVYLDHAATTPLRPSALVAMLPYLTERFGNPSGAHSIARAARQGLDDARERVGACLGVSGGGVVWTSGGTEADNLALVGALRAARPGATSHRGAGSGRTGSAGGRGAGASGTDAAASSGLVVCPAAEHHAVLDVCRALDGRVVEVDATGRVDLDSLGAALGPSVVVVSVMLVNNEVGTVSDLASVAALVRERAPRALLHTDAVQAACWLDLADATAPADLVSLGAHKFGGPKGIGALVVRDDAPVAAQLLGGGQERERRSGTQHVAGAVGMATALEEAQLEREATCARVGRWRDRLLAGLAELGATPTVDPRVAVPGACHVRFEGAEAEELLFALDELGVCASAASSCASGASEPSHVLAAMGISRRDAAASIRLSLGATTTQADVDDAVVAARKALERLRG